MKISPYECKPCAGYQMDAVTKALKLADLEGGLAPIQINGKTINSVWGIVPENKEIPPFAHPFPFKDRHDGQLVVIDSRAYARSRAGEPLVPANFAEYNFNAVRAALTSYALKHGVADMAGLGDLPMTVFARFLAEKITRQLLFSPQEQMLITMVSAVFYSCHFREADPKENGPFDERELQRLSLKVARATRIPAEVIFEHAGALRHMETIDDYVEVLREVLNNKRAEGLNVRLIYALVGGGWYGLNAKETTAVALEHLPTFLAMIYMSLLDRSYRNSGIGKTVLAADRSGAGKSFLLNLSRLIEVLNG